jgi:hypothetical protein
MSTSMVKTGGVISNQLKVACYRWAESRNWFLLQKQLRTPSCLMAAQAAAAGFL